MKVVSNRKCSTKPELADMFKSWLANTPQRKLNSNTEQYQNYEQFK